MDPVIYLFTDDGALDVGNFLADNDNSFSTFGDGSTLHLDSYLSTVLGLGNYVLAISDFTLSQADAINGINLTGFYPAADDGSGAPIDFREECTLNCSYADYQITFSGDVTVRGRSKQRPHPPLSHSSPPASAFSLGEGEEPHRGAP